jgi:hypothetical protein
MGLNQYMEIAIEEAKVSLREGNNGFGAVIIKDGKISFCEGLRKLHLNGDVH